MVCRTECFTSIINLLDTYQIQAKTEGKSPHTIRIYTTALNILQRFLERKGYPTDVTRIGTEAIREFIGYLPRIPELLWSTPLPDRRRKA